MSAHDNDELIDYDDEHDVVTTGAAVTSTTNGAVTASTGDESDKKNFSGMSCIC